MKRKYNRRTQQLEAEIKQTISKHGKLTGYGIWQAVGAPEMTTRDRVRALVQRGELDCVDGSTRRAKIYSIPVSAPRPMISDTKRKPATKKGREA